MCHTTLNGMLLFEGAYKFNWQFNSGHTKVCLILFSTTSLFYRSILSCRSSCDARMCEEGVTPYSFWYGLAAGPPISPLIWLVHRYTIFRLSSNHSTGINKESITEDHRRCEVSFSRCWMGTHGIQHSRNHVKELLMSCLIS